MKKAITVTWFILSIALVIGSEPPELRIYAIISIIIFLLQLRPFKYNRYRKLRRNGGAHTDQEWKQLKALYNNRCAACGQARRLTKDHIIPVSKGGRNSIKNIQPLCSSCNSKKGASIILY